VGDEEIESIDLQTFFVNLAVAWRPLEWLSIAAGADVVIGTVELRKGLDFVEQRGTLHAAAGALGAGGNAGILVRILEGRLSFGVNYRSAVELDFTGDADFTVPTPFASLMQDQPLESSITLPHRITLGVAWLPLDLLTLSLDVDITTWSSFDRFGFTFPEDADRPEDERLTQFEPRNWSDTYAIRFGVQVRPPDRDFALRLGLVYDRSPSPTDTMSPSLPDADRIDIAVGAGYEIGGGFRLDVAYMYVHMFERSTTGDAFPGTYRSSAHLVGFSLGYSYGG
jgi:long-chain fatty acid transport protein